MNPCVTWTLHAGSYCVLSQWRPRPRWWKVYSPDEAMQPWLTPPPPNPCCHGLESKRVPLSTHFTTLWVGDRPAPFLACFSLPLLRTMSLLVDWHTCVLLPIDLFFQEKHYKTIFLINIKTRIMLRGVIFEVFNSRADNCSILSKVPSSSSHQYSVSQAINMLRSF